VTTNQHKVTKLNHLSICKHCKIYPIHKRFNPLSVFEQNFYSTMSVNRFLQFGFVLCKTVLHRIAYMVWQPCKKAIRVQAIKA